MTARSSRPVTIVKDGKTYEFGSMKEGSRFLHYYDSYIVDAVSRHGVEFVTGNGDLVKVGKHSGLRHNSIPVTLTSPAGEIHDFPSLTQASFFMGKSRFYLHDIMCRKGVDEFEINGYQIVAKRKKGVEHVEN